MQFYKYDNRNANAFRVSLGLKSCNSLDSVIVGANSISSLYVFVQAENCDWLCSLQQGFLYHVLPGIGFAK